MTSPASHPTLGVLTELLDGAHLATPDQLPDVVQAAVSRLGWTAVMYLVDYEQRLLVTVPPTGMAAEEPQRIDSTLAGRVFRTVTPVSAPEAGGTLWLPLLDGVERLGVLRINLPPDWDTQDRLLHDACRWLAQLIGHLVALKRPYGGALERVRRRRPRTVASELLWQLLPPLTFGCEGLVMSGLLEPCYDVAADAFDYGVNGDVANLAIFDATGHDLRGTLLAAVALAAYRTQRKQDATLDETVRTLDEAVAEQGGGQAFVTGVLAQLDLRTGRLRYVNAGHPAPLLLRGGRVVKPLSGGHRILLGLGRGEVEVAEEWLEPQDWVILYTDGVTEARGPGGHFFGLERLVDFVERSAAADLPAPETLRRLIHAVLDHQNGVLQDDATVVIAQWDTGKERALRPM